MSHRKLNMLGRQISGKPIDHAILQMQFSEKRASTRIMNMLATARDHASRYKRLQEGKLVVGKSYSQSIYLGDVTQFFSQPKLGSTKDLDPQREWNREGEGTMALGHIFTRNCV